MKQFMSGVHKRLAAFPLACVRGVCTLMCVWGYTGMYRSQRSASGCYPLLPSIFGITLFVRVVRVDTTASTWRPEEGFRESGFLFHLVEVVSLGTATWRTPGWVTLGLPGGFSCLPSILL